MRLLLKFDYIDYNIVIYGTNDCSKLNLYLLIDIVRTVII